MEIKMNFNSFIKLKDFVKINDIMAEIDEYYIKDDQIQGKLSVRGKYFKDDLEKEYHFDTDIPFNIIFNEKYEIEDIDCTNFDYHMIEGRGLELDFDILVNYQENSESNNNEHNENNENNENNELIEMIPFEMDEEILTSDVELENEDLREIELENEDLEHIKEDETKKVDELLTETLENNVENLPTEEKMILRNIPNRYSVIKICYYKNEEELEEICNDNNISMNKMFKDNRKNEFSKYRRIIINNGKY